MEIRRLVPFSVCSSSHRQHAESLYRNACLDPAVESIRHKLTGKHRRGVEKHFRRVDNPAIISKGLSQKY